MDQRQQAALKYGRSIDQLARQRYGISGPELLLKLDQGESGGRSNAVSPVGAKGDMQFMDSSRRIAIQKYGVDPLKNVDQAFHAAALHLQGKINGSKGLEGYNPGGGQKYVSYILGQKVKLPSSATVASTPTIVAPPQGSSDATVEALLSHARNPKRSLIEGMLYNESLAPQPSVTVPSVKASPTTGGSLAEFVSRANKVDAAKVPYLWGGGHGGTPAKLGTPVDCSGAVSQILGINPRVSGQFTKWGNPGRDPSGVNVYANGEHVLMEIGGHFFGTSHSNPGGGAGWIRASAIPKGYLKRFTVRHL